MFDGIVHVKILLIDGLFRIVDFFTEEIAYKRNGQPWDGGGHANISTAIQQATNINSGDEVDTTLPKGDSGNDGKDGSVGGKGDSGVGFSFREEWSSENLYNKNDIIRYKENLYIWNVDEKGNGVPSVQDEWKLFLNLPAQPQALFGGRGRELPSGGSTGQVLKKSSDTDYQVEWGDDQNDGAGGGSGTGLSESGILGNITSNEVNVTGDGTTYTVGSSGVTEVYDIGLDFNAGTGIYTAPSDGAYAVLWQFEVDNVQFKDYRALIVTTGTYADTIEMIPEPIDFFGETEEPSKYRFTFSGIIRISSSGTCKATVSVGSGGEGKTSSVLSSKSIISVSQVSEFTTNTNNTLNWLGL